MSGTSIEHVATEPEMVLIRKDELDRLRGDYLLTRDALGELIDALSDEVRYEVSQSEHVVNKIDDACRLLGPEYLGYIGKWL